MTQTPKAWQTFDVKFICGQPNYASKGKRAEHEKRNGVEIFRCWGTRLDKNVVAFRLVNMLTPGLTKFVKSLLKFRRGDKVLVVTAPPSLPYQTGFAALMKGSGYYLLLHDLYPDILVAVSGAKRSSILVRAIDVANRWLYKHAAKIIAVGRDMKELLEAKTSGLDVPIAVIPNWADMANIEPRPRDENELLDELRVKEKLVFLYAGNIGHPTDIKSIVSAAEMMRGEPIHFIFVGSGAKLPWLREEVRRWGLRIHLGQLPSRPTRVFLNAGTSPSSRLSKECGDGDAEPHIQHACHRDADTCLDRGRPELARVIDEERRLAHSPGARALVEVIREIMARRQELGRGQRARRPLENTHPRSRRILQELSRMRSPCNRSNGFIGGLSLRSSAAGLMLSEPPVTLSMMFTTY